MFKVGDVVVGNSNMLESRNRGRVATVAAIVGPQHVAVTWSNGEESGDILLTKFYYKNGPGSGVNDGKADGGKVDPGMLFQGCARALRGVLAVLEFGAKKYAADSWRKVPNAMRRYHAAFQRHKQTTDIEGLWARDPETGLYEVDHMITNLLFLRELKAAEDAEKP